MIDVTAAIIFHAEGWIAQASILSFAQCSEVASAAGVEVRRMALLDRPDEPTLAVVRAAAHYFDQLEVVDFGDLGASRNYAVSMSDTAYVAFFDGDDLWGDQWILRAYRHAELTGDGVAVVHPRVIEMFSSADYAVQSQSSGLHGSAVSHFVVQQDSWDPDFDPRSLLLANAWSANNLAPRSVFEQFPYRPVDDRLGYGFEDWTWNLDTLAAGIPHLVVPDTVHCIRIKAEGSLGRELAALGFCAPVHEHSVAIEELWRQRMSVRAHPKP